MALHCIGASALHHTSGISIQLFCICSWRALWLSNFKVPLSVNILFVSSAEFCSSAVWQTDIYTFSRPRIIFTFHPAESLKRRLWPPSYASFVCLRVNRLFNSAKHRQGSALNTAGQSSLLAGASVKWKVTESKLNPCIPSNSPSHYV